MFPLEWRETTGLVSYPKALAIMENRVAAIQISQEKEMVWLLEHPSLYTAGTSTKDSDLVDTSRFPVYKTGRGGQFTYHGPGQRIVYVMINLSKRRQDLRAYIWALEQWIIDTLSLLGVKGERRVGRVGIWAVTEEKIAAIGVRISKWVTYHGIAINVAPNLDHFSGIIPCGLPQFGITSLEKLGVLVTLVEIDSLLKTTWSQNSFLARGEISSSF